MKLRIGLAAVLLACAGTALGEIAEEYTLKAAFIYNFSLFAQWPDEPAAAFRLCFYGKHPFGRVLQSLEGKTRNQIPIVLEFPQTIEQARACQILYFDPVASKDSSQLLEALRQTPVLTVSDHALAWTQGAMIVMAVSSNRVIFDIDHSRARATGIRLSAQLLRLARTVR